ncbi:MAG TPA: winged helix-turn-helix transcriptional regulator [Thermoflexia bacterium]|nr:winged helix-turn-helix transcriptional regulator [Thermoflexia bacterium]
MTEGSAQPVDRLLDLLNRLRRLGPGQPPFEEIRVTPSQLLLLDWVAAFPGCPVREIAEGLGLTPPTVSVGVRRLEEAGLVERRPDPRDRRAVRLFLTPQGEALHRRAQAYRRQKAQRLLVGLTPQEQESMLDLLERAISAAEGLEERQDTTDL